MKKEEIPNQGKIRKHDGTHINFSDMLLYLDNGQLLIGRVLAEGNDTPDPFIHIFHAAEIYVDDTGINIAPWIPESSDNILNIPGAKVLCVANPRQDILEVYQDSFFGTPGEKQVDQIEGEQKIVKKKKKMVH